MAHAHASGKRLSLTVVLLATLAAGCNKNTNPTPTLSTDTLTGAIDPLGTDFKTFKVNYPTLLTDASVTVTALTAASTGTALSASTTIGVGFGSIAFDGSCTRSTTYSAANAPINKELIAPGVFSQGTYCVQVFDSGTLTERTNYTLVVKHY
jgi:hypothetical protein